MYSKQDLISEIAAKVDALRSLGASDSELNSDWIAQDILNDHPDVDEFTVCTARATVHKEVLRQLNMLKPDDELLRELDIDHMTDEEFEAKAAKLEAMAKDCEEHADELERFIASRRTDVSQAYAPGEEPAGEDSP
ncbi:MAG: hypothetical protein M3255_06995 [Pseudomonadota bacterium]|nr:hypothetical protein [Pseudomonadota bacterium]